MIYFTRLNLLPYRDWAREAKKKQFRNMLLLAFVVVLATIFALYLLLNSMIDKQQDRNRYLQSSIDKMSKDLKKISELEDEKERLIVQKDSLKNLQVERFLIAQIMNDLDKITPKGVQLIKIEPAKSRQDKQYVIYGRAVSDNRVAMFLKEIGTTELFKNNPVMNEIKTKNGTQEFKITVTLVNQNRF